MGRTLEERINGAEPEPWIPEEAGDYVIGELEEISEREGDYGPYRVVTLLAPDGGVWNVAGFGTVLSGKFASLKETDIGNNVAVKFLGEAASKRPGGKPYKNWTMSVDRTAVPVLPGGGFAPDDDI